MQERVLSWGSLTGFPKTPKHGSSKGTLRVPLRGSFKDTQDIRLPVTEMDLGLGLIRLTGFMKGSKTTLSS